VTLRRNSPPIRRLGEDKKPGDSSAAPDAQLPDNKGQMQPQGWTAPFSTGSGGAPAADGQFSDNVGPRSKWCSCAADDEADARRQKARREAELMVSEKIGAAFEATASLMAGTSGDEIVHRYRRHVAKNADRLDKLNFGRSRNRARKRTRRRRKLRCE
jgi:hypothetical protein